MALNSHFLGFLGLALVLAVQIGCKKSSPATSTPKEQLQSVIYPERLLLTTMQNQTIGVLSHSSGGHYTSSFATAELQKSETGFSGAVFSEHAEFFAVSRTGVKPFEAPGFSEASKVELPVFRSTEDSTPTYHVWVYFPENKEVKSEPRTEEGPKPVSPQITDPRQGEDGNKVEPVREDLR